MGAMTKAKASSMTASRKKPKLGKIKSEIVWKGKAAHKLVRNSSKTKEGKNQGFTEGSATTTSRETKSNSRRACTKIDRNNLTLIQKLKELASEAEDDE